MSKRIHLIQKGDSNSKHFSFFVFYFNISNKISSTPPRLLNFQEFSNPSFIPTARLLSFEEFSNPPPPLLLGTQEYPPSRLLEVNIDFFEKYICDEINASICFLKFPNELKQRHIVPAYTHQHL